MPAERLKATSAHAKRVLGPLKREIAASVRLMLEPPGTWSWQRFHAEVRGRGTPLLRELPRFRNAVLVAGCQRSGTTILARVISGSDGMIDYRKRSDDELDAALILCGLESARGAGRYCFQTTYLNESYPEYFDPAHDYRLIWVARNPFSVVCSMKYNWERFAFDELFDACGHALLDEDEQSAYRKWGRVAISKTRRACLSYMGKELQALELKAKLGEDRMLVIDYEQMVLNGASLLPRVYDFIRLPFAPRYAAQMHQRSLRKADLLNAKERRMIESLCMPAYERVRALAAAM